MKAAIKSVARGLAILVVAPLALPEILARRLVGRDCFFEACSQIFSIAPGHIGTYLRVAFYRLTLRHCERDVFIGFGTIFSQSDVRIEAKAYIGLRCSLGRVAIGEATMLSDGVYVLSGARQHGTRSDRPFQEQEQTFSSVAIGKNCWIGTASIVMAEVGDNCVVGAGSVVTRPVPPESKVAGVPAKPLH
jgi:virginiamycin A acetyltransferase